MPAASDSNPGSATAAVVDPVLEVVGAKKSYGDRQALRGLSLSVGSTEIYALIGPNGAGKTTLVRSICRRLELDDGTIEVLGQDPRHSVTTRKSIGLVPQAIALYTELSVRENLEIFGRLAGVARREIAAAVEDALDWTDLAARAGDRVSALSGGMQRRLNIAVATLHAPRLLLLDEPTVGVDPQAREAIHDLLRRLKASGLAILLTTHDLEQAEELADRIGVLVDGELCAEGSLSELVGGAFGKAKEIHVALSEPPAEAAREALENEGLRATRDVATWSGPLLGGLDGLAAIGNRLSAAGLTVDEFRVREPGLRGVFLQLTGRELTP